MGSLLLGLSWVALVVYLRLVPARDLLGHHESTGMTFFSTVSGASHRGTSMAIFSAALLGGQAIGPAAAGLIASVGGWRVAMFVGATVAGSWFSSCCWPGRTGHLHRGRARRRSRACRPGEPVAACH